MQLVFAGVEVAAEDAGRKDDWPQEARQSRGKHHCTKSVVDCLDVPFSRILVARTRGDELPASKVSNVRLERGKVVCVQCTQR
jgi:hypothetical protein